MNKKLQNLKENFNSCETQLQKIRANLLTAERDDDKEKEKYYDRLHYAVLLEKEALSKEIVREINKKGE
jgi:hypothetical protein